MHVYEIWNICFQDISTQRRFPKMIIALYLLDTHPAEKYPTVATNHLVAPINLLNSVLTVRTSFGTVLKIIYVHLLIHLVHMFVLDVLYIIIIFHLGEVDLIYLNGWTLFEHVHFFLASQAKYKIASCTLPKVLLLIYFSRGCTLCNRTPPEVIHLFHCLVD